MPLLIHEQNADRRPDQPLARATSRAEVARGLPGQLWRRGVQCALHRQSGARRDAQRLRRRSASPGADSRRACLVFGGSQGAQLLNQLVPEALARCRRAAAAGAPSDRPRRQAAGEARYRALGVEAEVRPFIDDMARGLRVGGSGVCRGGALTVAELAAAGSARAGAATGGDGRSSDSERRRCRRARRRGARCRRAGSMPARSRRCLTGCLRGRHVSAARWRRAARRAAVPDAAARLAELCLDACGVSGMNDRMRRIHRIHFVGIGGSGMGGIAEVLLNLGYEVQGSDVRRPTPSPQRSRGLGAQIFIGHAAAISSKAATWSSSRRDQQRKPGSCRGACAQAHAGGAARRDARPS